MFQCTCSLTVKMLKQLCWAVIDSFRTLDAAAFISRVELIALAFTLHYTYRGSIIIGNLDCAPVCVEFKGSCREGLNIVADVIYSNIKSKSFTQLTQTI